MADEEDEVELHADQARAVALIGAHSVCCVTGPAGTGKSTIMRHAVRALRAAGERTIFLGPTGKSVQVIQSCVGAETAATIARAAATPAVAHPFRGGNVITDESSMVDVEHLDAVIREFDPARLVLLGDVMQLRPVRGASVLGAMVACRHVPAVELTRIYRQGPDTALARVLAEMRLGRQMSTAALENDGVSFVRSDRSDLVSRVERLCGGPDCPTVLCTTNATREILNPAVQRVRNPDGQPLPPPHGAIRVGDPVMALSNTKPPLPKARTAAAAAAAAAKRARVDADDEEEEEGERAWAGGMVACNGTLGVADCVDGVPMIRYASTDAAGRPAEFVDSFCFHREKFKVREFVLAYVLTVDKSQGSQFDSVVFVLDDEDRRATRELVYTGISRAKREVVFLSNDGSLETATRVQPEPLSPFAVALRGFDYRRLQAEDEAAAAAAREAAAPAADPPAASADSVTV